VLIAVYVTLVVCPGKQERQEQRDRTEDRVRRAMQAEDRPQNAGQTRRSGGAPPDFPAATGASDAVKGVEAERYEYRSGGSGRLPNRREEDSRRDTAEEKVAHCLKGREAIQPPKEISSDPS
jgi:hypothetical protein